MNIEKMAEVATTKSTDGKSQISQLLALRYLTEEAAAVKKDKG